MKKGIYSCLSTGVLAASIFGSVYLAFHDLKDSLNPQVNIKRELNKPKFVCSTNLSPEVAFIYQGYPNMFEMTNTNVLDRTKSSELED